MDFIIEKGVISWGDILFWGVFLIITSSLLYFLIKRSKRFSPETSKALKSTVTTLTAIAAIMWVFLSVYEIFSKDSNYRNIDRVVSDVEEAYSIEFTDSRFITAVTEANHLIIDNGKSLQLGTDNQRFASVYIENITSYLSEDNILRSAHLSLLVSEIDGVKHFKIMELSPDNSWSIFNP